MAAALPVRSNSTLSETGQENPVPGISFPENPETAGEKEGVIDQAGFRQTIWAMAL